MNSPKSANRIAHRDFRVRGQLAAGGMGAVLEAEEVTTRRTVALKVMHLAAMSKPESRRRFLLEARVMARLEHPNILPMHVLMTDAEGKPFYTMKKVVGRDLKQVLASLREGDADAMEEFPLSRLLAIFQRICDAIGYAHSKGIVHRDLKPANVMIGQFGEVLVMDWGLAKILDHPEESSADDGASANVEDFGLECGMTVDGTVMGTPQFMAPEQTTGRNSDVDTRSDIWALGAILYSILTLHPPVTAATMRDLLARVRSGDITPPTHYNSSRQMRKLDDVQPNFSPSHCPGGRVPPGLSIIAMRAMRVEPDQRYQSAEEMRDDVEAWRNGFATSAEEAGVLRELTLLIRRHKLVASAIAIVACLAVFFGTQVFVSMRRSMAAVSQLRASIPLYIANVDLLVADGDYAAAHDQLDQCIAILPDRADFHIQKAQLLQTQLELESAARHLEIALKLDPTRIAVREELQFTGQLLKDLGQQEPYQVRLRLVEHLDAQRRWAELTVAENMIHAGDEESSDLTLGLVGHWNFEEGQGTLTSDSSGNGNHGTLIEMDDSAWMTDAPPTSLAGKTSIRFNAGEDRVVIRNSPSFDISEAITIALWSKIYLDSDRRKLITKGYDRSYSIDGDFWRYRFQLPAEGRARRDFYCNAPKSKNATWRHLAVRYDGRTVDCFADGIKRTSEPHEQRILISDRDIGLGGVASGGQGIKGQLDDVRIYNRALNDFEIAVLAGKVPVPVENQATSSHER